MKVLKDVEHGLLFTVFGLGGKWYLQAAVSLFFPLDDPDAPLPEKEMWQCAARCLPKGTVLDAGYPKPRGEFLAAGSCYAPGGSAPAGRAAVRVGPLSRELAVFGDREWVRGPSGLAPGPARPFAEMPLDWSRAFGGHGFEENPAGKGAGPVDAPWGETLRPLPNVEEPPSLVGLPTDAPVPASFLPLPFNTPSRRKLAGTYGDAWRRERWPGLPDDVDMRFFNLASAPQVLPDGFFAGGEAVAVEGMHPKRRGIESRLPKKRVRVFATRVPDPKKPGEARFEELTTRLETVWLFPSEERGAVFYRCAVETADDEHADIARLFVAVEDMDEEPKGIDFYRDEQQRRLARGAEIDQGVMDAAKAEMDKAVRAVRTIAQDVNEVLDASFGQAPNAAPSPQAREAARVAQVHKSIEHVEKAQARLREVKGTYGHLAKINVRMFDTLHAHLLSLLPLIKESGARQAAAAARRAQSRQELLAAKDKGLTPPQIAKRDALIREKGFDPTTLQPLPRQEELWPAAALRLLAEAREALFAEPARLDVLTGNGLRRKDVRRAHLGWLAEARDFDPAQWGLRPEDLPAEMGDRLVIGPGLLVPHFTGARCVRLAVRQMRPQVGPKEPVPALPCPETVVPGSGDGVQAYGAGAGRPILLCPDPLAARLCYAEAGDAYCIVIPSSPAAKAPNDLAMVLKDAPLALLPLAHGAAPDEDAAKTLAKPYAALAPGLRPHVAPADFPGPDLFAARAAGLDLRGWLLDPLRALDLPLPAEAGAVLPSKEGGALAIAVPRPDVKGIVGASRERAKAQITANNKAIGLRGQMMGEARAALAAKGKDPALVDAPVPPRPDGPDPDVLAAFDKTKQGLVKTGSLTPEREAKIDAARAEYEGVATRMAQVRASGMANLEAARAKAANPMPTWAAQKMSAQCLEGGKKAATPEKILALKASGGSLAGVDLSGLDFTGQELSGLDFRRAIIRGTIFSNARLDGAKFDQTIGGKTIFTGASLRGASFDKAVLAGSDFTDADLSDATCTLSEFSKCRFIRTVLDRARLDKAQLSGSEFTQASCAGASFERCLMRGGTVEKTRFDGAVFNRCAFDRTAFSEVSFAGGALRSSLFSGCTGEKVRFSNADCSNLRLLRGSSFPHVSFAGCTLDRASWRESSLTGASLDGCTLKNAAINACDLAGGNLSGCKAQGARIRKSDLSGANLSRLNLHGGSLRKSRLLSADLRAANCYAVDFYKAVFNETRLSGANLRHSLIEEHEETMRREGMIL